ncbi:MAG: signal peptidase I [Proteobacteria bacterium]|nr:signal peptidase I [Pseudomonadota bacterium]
MTESEKPETRESPRRRERWGETLRAIFWAALLALAIRSFVVEPFKIPSGSMIPTLLVGDYVLVNKFSYGVRLPVTGTLLFGASAPRRGDIVVFKYPDDGRQDFIKRVVGLPGDRVEIRGDRLWVNGQPVDRVERGSFAYDDSHRRTVQARRYAEISADGAQYSIIRTRERRGYRASSGPWFVPEDHFFMMGDNRDNSSDSRVWQNSFVAAEKIKGRAFRIHWSWVVASGPQPERGFVLDLLYTLYRLVTFQVEEVRWNRIGRSLAGPAD